MLTADLRLQPPYGAGPLTWFWPAIDAACDPGSLTSAQLQRQATQRSRELTSQTAGRVGAMLLAQNRRSVEHRYDEQEREQPYLFIPLPGAPDPVIVLKAIACYRCQSCEHPGWAGSEAAAFCEALQQRAIVCLPGYAAAPWEIDHAHVFRANHR
jgi:hypothetical protein